MFSTFLRALACCAVTVPMFAQAAPYTVRDFMADPKFSAPRLSPGGQYLAMTAPVNDRKRLVIIDIAANKILQTASFGERDEVRRFWWIADDRVAFDRVTRVGYLDAPLYTCKLYAMGVDGSKRVQLWGEEVGNLTCGYMLNTLKEDDRNVVIASYGFGTLRDQPKPSAFRVDSTNGKRWNLNVSPAENGSFVTDRNGEPRIALGTNEKTGAPQLYYRALGSHDWTDISKVLDGDLDAEVLGFAADNLHFLLQLVGADGHRSILLVNPVTLETRSVFGRKDVDIYSNTAIGVDPYLYDDQDVVGVTLYPGFPERVYFDTKSLVVRLTAALEAAFPDEIVDVYNVTRDGKRAVANVWSDTNPGTLYLIDVPTMKVSRMFDRYPHLKPADMALTEPVAFKARDGTALHGYLTLPKGRNKGLPLVTLVHGGPHGIRDLWGFDPEVQLLAHHGYAVLQVNYRGSGGYGDDFETSGYRKWGTAMQDDLSDGAAWAVAQGYADKSRLCIMGGSYGGYAALMGVVREPDLYKCAVGLYGVYDLPLMHRTGNVTRFAWGENYLEAALGTDQADLVARSPLYHVGKIKADLFLAHGGQDEQAHYDNFHRLREALDKIGKKHEWMWEPGEGHGFADVENRVELYTRILAFLQRNIGGADTRTAAPDAKPSP